MAKLKTRWVCTSCGYETASYLGRCPDCGNFSTFIEEVFDSKVEIKTNSPANAVVTGDLTYNKIDEVKLDETIRVKAGIGELDRVLGGGFVEGSLVLLAGDPGIGKSTLVLQAAKNIADSGKKILYICAEESPSQVKLRAKRLNASSDNLYVTAQNCLEEVLKLMDELNPDFLVVDSIQSVFSAAITSSSGTVSQIRECTNLLMRVAKTKTVTTIVIGHVTKEGNIAGPKVLEHMVDCVINFEGDKFRTYRMLRSIKNRFGPSGEVGVFTMDEDGLAEIKNPSELFLSEKNDENYSGCTVIATVEGSRCLLLEVQALVGNTPYPSPRRVARGVEYNRLLQILAVLEKRVGLNLSKQDVYINVTGGVDTIEPAADLGIAIAILACIRDVCCKKHLVIIGEIGLLGEIRPVDNLEKRLKEAQKLGFKEAIIPKITSKRTLQQIENLEIKTIQVSKVIDAITKAI